MSRSPAPRGTSPPRQKGLERIAELGRNVYGTVREISQGIRPAVLEDLGLAAAVRTAVSNFPLPVDLDVDEAVRRRYRPEVESAVLFFVSETLANVLKHAQARRVRLVLHCGTSDLDVSVTDDGVGGLDPQGAGIRGLLDRVESVGGCAEIVTRPGMSRVFARFAAAGES